MPVIQAEEMRRLSRQEPFQPFLIRTRAGEVFEILDPMNILVGDTVVVVPVHGNPADLYGDYPAEVEYDQIAGVEPIGVVGASRNGGA